MATRGKKPIDLIGQRFDRLTVTAKVRMTRNGGLWSCACDCGNVCERLTTQLRSQCKSVMCLECRKVEWAKQFTTHGLSIQEQQIYRIWTGIRKRCRDPKDKGYIHYGAKGIDRCKEWDDPVVFIGWAKENGYQPGLTLDRLDPSKNYQPNNCEWVTRAENTRRMNVHRRAAA